MSEQVFQTRYETYRTAVESYLETLFAGRPDWRDLSESMRYSLLAGGKRIRPVLTLEFARLAGLADWKTALPMACALELVHTYSLIHDDLPCMDDADTRRGQAACHKKFGEATALLAADALLTEAFEVIAASGAGDAQKAAAVACLAAAAGGRGMVYGQELDLALEKKQPSEQDLTRIHTHKTGDLIHAAGLLGVLASDHTARDEEECGAYTRAIGLVFQIVDDVLDCTSTAQQMGKPVGNDAAAGKVTFATLKGPEAAMLQAQQLTGQACDRLTGVYGGRAAFLVELARSLAARRS